IVASRSNDGVEVFELGFDPGEGVESGFYFDKFSCDERGEYGVLRRQFRLQCMAAYPYGKHVMKPGKRNITGDNDSNFLGRRGSVIRCRPLAKLFGVKIFF